MYFQLLTTLSLGFQVALNLGETAPLNGFRIVLVAFVFNWLGFFAAYCMTKTVAGRYGAISGFGLSVVKWVLILKVRVSILMYCYPYLLKQS